MAKFSGLELVVVVFPPPGISRLSKRLFARPETIFTPILPRHFSRIPSHPVPKSDAATMEREFRRTMHFPLHQ
jgi:hypothetical protein